MEASERNYKTALATELLDFLLQIGILITCLKYVQLHEEKKNEINPYGNNHEEIDFTV